MDDVPLSPEILLGMILNNIAVLTNKVGATLRVVELVAQEDRADAALDLVSGALCEVEESLEHLASDVCAVDRWFHHGPKEGA